MAAVTGDGGGGVRSVSHSGSLQCVLGGIASEWNGKKQRACLPHWRGGGSRCASGGKAARQPPRKLATVEGNGGQRAPGREEAGDGRQRRGGGHQP